MILGEKQEKFAAMVPDLILAAIRLGFKVRLGDAYRDPRVFGKFGVKKGYGHANSKHKLKLAIDLLLVKNGKYLTDTKDYEPLGLYWESIGGVWGGRFGEVMDENRNVVESGWDGNHFEYKE